ncbi:sigma 54-interacting transcriptional regulator [Aneurinibacillus aneurinilyticus]|uniref:Sigma 54-interacting transcriptional regulator n=1 Tax=Aneurinibacillus aneurinilyticus TaxID=1391 RepID=A0A848CY08_ANEAE|nr:sigma 54-interacting transcriptional regulator [Aneurinibacillus aneurinilyticus]NME99369.1 sigma 54-interacting transcriptional regulator [Aneurinibacillus aneurinilyticus]
MKPSLSLTAIWNFCSDAMILTNESGEAFALNRAAMRLFSFTSGSTETISIFELIPDPSFSKHFKPRQPTTGISILLGTQELSISVVPFPAPHPSYFLVIIKNITEQQNLKYQLQSAKETLRFCEMIFDEMSEGICAIDTQGKIQFYNKKMGTLDLREPQAVKGKRVFEVWPNITEESSTLFTSLRLAKPLSQREVHFTNTGKAITTVARTIPLKVDGKSIGAVQISSDITEKKHLTEIIRTLQTKEESVLTSQNNEDKRKKINNHTRFQFQDIICANREMRKTIEHSYRAARSSSNVLITGETGTGKELFAQSIHNESKRRNKPFIAQNCAALPENLLESLLFGTIAGSFTGAVDREGLFEQAQGGTLLLDEINSMSLNLQAKLLRALQEKKIQRLGASRVIDVDVRIIATINEEPLKAIEEKRLREDLFYRLSVVHISIPPLRQRKEDILVLIDHFIQKHKKKLDVHVKKMDPDIQNFFLDYQWPGNVRQLEHAIEGCLNLIYDEDIITFEHLPPTFREQMLESLAQPISPPAKSFSHVPQWEGTLAEQLEKIEVLLIEKALQETNGNITKAGSKLGVSRQNLNYKLKKYQISFSN